MKKFWKVTCAFTAAVMTLGALSGCGQKKTDTAQTDSDVTEIHIWTGDTGNKIQQEIAINEFNDTIGKEKGIKVVYEAMETLGQSVTVALQTNQAPELFMAGSVAEYSEQGYIVALDDMPGGPEMIEKYTDLLVEDRQVYKGKTYSLPYAADTYGLIYNKDMFKEAGLVDENGEATPPKTLDEVREYAKILTDPAAGKYGIVFPMKWSGFFGIELTNAVLAASGSDGYDFTTGKYDFNCYRDVLEMILGIKEDNSYMPGAEGLDNDPARSRFAEGNIGMKLSVSWDVGVLGTQFPAKCDWGVAPLPMVQEGENYYQGFNLNTGLKISKDGVDRVGADKIMEVYKWWISDELAVHDYELGIKIPIRTNIIEMADSSNQPKNQKEYSEMVGISLARPKERPYDISGETDFGTDFLNNVWTGNKSLDQAIEDANRIYNAGVEKYQSLHPEETADKYIIEGYSRAR